MRFCGCRHRPQGTPHYQPHTYESPCRYTKCVVGTWGSLSRWRLCSCVKQRIPSFLRASLVCRLCCSIRPAPVTVSEPWLGCWQCSGHFMPFKVAKLCCRPKDMMKSIPPFTSEHSRGGGGETHVLAKRHLEICPSEGKAIPWLSLQCN